MRMFILLFALGAACGSTEGAFQTSTLARDDVVSDTVPPARAGTSPPRWEYLCLQNPPKAQLAEAGAQGWEAAHYATVALLCFRRALPAS
ncbi:MAG TPA: hypothetical protein VL463_36820 [Kofleriaceae bacterium]|nr:hypothetical protein [Kofleriaceae bacterium]